MAGMSEADVRALLEHKLDGVTTKLTEQFTAKLTTLETTHQREVDRLHEQIAGKDRELTELRQKQREAEGRAPIAGPPQLAPPATVISTVATPPLPQFAGSDNCEQQFSLWELDFISDMEAQNHRRDEWVRRLRRFLTGKALSAYHEFLSVDDNPAYDVLADKLRHRFDRTKTAAEHQRELDSMQWRRGESLDQFVERLFAVCSKAKKGVVAAERELSIKRACHDVFFKCMSVPVCKHIRSRIWAGNFGEDVPIELSVLCRWVKDFHNAEEEDALKLRARSGPTPNRGDRTDRRNVSAPSNQSQQVQSGGTLSSAAGSYTRPSPPTAASGGRTVRCHHCNEEGVVDYFSGYLKFIALKDEKAETIARALVENIFNVFGAPKFIVSDQGVNFTSVLLRELESIFSIRHHFTSTFMPRSNGKIERANRTLKALLTRMTLQYPEDWDDLLSHVLFAYNSTPQDSTGYAPHYLIFGRLPQPVNDSIFDRKTLGHKLDLDDYVSEFERQLAFAYKSVEEELGKGQIRQKLQYDKTACSSGIAVGDSVMLYRPDLKKSKLTALFDGPYTVEWLKGSVAGIRGLNAATVETHNIEKLSRCDPDMNANCVQKRKLRTHFRRRQEATALQGGGSRRYNLRSANSEIVSVNLEKTPVKAEKTLMTSKNGKDRGTDHEKPTEHDSSSTPICPGLHQFGGRGIPACLPSDICLLDWSLSDESEGETEGLAVKDHGDPMMIDLCSSDEKEKKEDGLPKLAASLAAPVVSGQTTPLAKPTPKQLKRKRQKMLAKERKKAAIKRDRLAKAVSVPVWDVPPPGLVQPSTSAVLAIVAPMQGGQPMGGRLPPWDLRSALSLGSRMGRDLDWRQLQNLNRNPHL